MSAPSKAPVVVGVNVTSKVVASPGKRLTESCEMVNCSLEEIVASRSDVPSFRSVTTSDAVVSCTKVESKAIALSPSGTTASCGSPSTFIVTSISSLGSPATVDRTNTCELYVRSFSRSAVRVSPTSVLLPGGRVPCVSDGSTNPTLGFAR